MSTASAATNSKRSRAAGKDASNKKSKKVAEEEDGCERCTTLLQKTLYRALAAACINSKDRSELQSQIDTLKTALETANRNLETHANRAKNLEEELKVVISQRKDLETCLKASTPVSSYQLVAPARNRQPLQLLEPQPQQEQPTSSFPHQHEMYQQQHQQYPAEHQFAPLHPHPSTEITNHEGDSRTLSNPTRNLHYSYNGGRFSHRPRHLENVQPPRHPQADTRYPPPIRNTYIDSSYRPDSRYPEQSPYPPHPDVFSRYLPSSSRYQNVPYSPRPDSRSSLHGPRYPSDRYPDSYSDYHHPEDRSRRRSRSPRPHGSPHRSTVPRDRRFDYNRNDLEDHTYSSRMPRTPSDAAYRRPDDRMDIAGAIPAHPHLKDRVTSDIDSTTRPAGDEMAITNS
ncbi:hypothetical protein K438DRAFT_1956054 [Mycena galopus ATCC 62051]|nr:hypothetical protein K438DRAFT_1956054 [Mycena galopus ATCC 62051]